MEEEGKSVNEEPRPHGFWKSWYLILKAWFFYGAFLIAIFIFSYLTGCDVISFLL